MWRRCWTVQKTWGAEWTPAEGWERRTAQVNYMSCLTIGLLSLTRAAHRRCEGRRTPDRLFDSRFSQKTSGNNEINNGWIPWTATVLGLVHCHTVMAYWHTWIEQSHIIVNRSYLCFSEYEKSKYLLWKKFSMSKTISILLHSNVANDHLTFHSTGNQRWKSFLL